VSLQENGLWELESLSGKNAMLHRREENSWHGAVPEGFLLPEDHSAHGTVRCPAWSVCWGSGWSFESLGIFLSFIVADFPQMSFIKTQNKSEKEEFLLELKCF
jgi:hypothetical protein